MHCIPPNADQWPCFSAAVRWILLWPSTRHIYTPLPHSVHIMDRCEAHAAPLRVAVLVSGGVDSSLALQLVAAAGHKPTAFYLQVRDSTASKPQGIFGCCTIHTDARGNCSSSIIGK